MIKYYGMTIPVKMQELLTPTHTAVLVVDVQNDYCIREGRPLFPETLKRLQRLLVAARECGVQIIHIQDTLLRKRRSDSPAWVRHYMRAHKLSNPRMLPQHALVGTYGHQFVEGFEPLGDEIVIQKYRSSAFHGTSLDMLLRNGGVRTTVVTGVATQGCVESTARDASNEYFVVVAADCVASTRKDLHEACLKIMRSRYDVLESGQIISVWTKQRRGNR